MGCVPCNNKQGDPTGGGVPTRGLRVRHQHLRAAHQGHRQGLQEASKRGGDALLLARADDALARGETAAFMLGTPKITYINARIR